MTRAEFIQRAALTYGADAIKAMEHIKALADAVDEVAPFEEPDRQAALEAYGHGFVEIAKELPGVDARVLGSRGESAPESAKRVAGEIVRAVRSLMKVPL